MKNSILMVIQDPPYGTEKVWNAFRLGKALLIKEADLKIFLLADAVNAAKRGQKVPNGFYNLENMLEELIKYGAEVKLCATCCNSRAITPDDLIDGAQIGGTVTDLTNWTLESDKVLSF